MASNMEPVAVTSQKHDPAWKHCQMFKYGDKVHLKCIYCGKVFKGGGIHRIKEHLACQKGNAATCLRVQPDVRLQMIESLNSVASKKRKKQKLSEEISVYDNNPGSTSHESLMNNRPEIDLLPVPEMLEQIEDVNREGDVGEKLNGRKKKGRIRKAHDVVPPNAIPLTCFQAVKLKKVSNSVSMAVGRFFVDVGLPLNAVNSAYFQPMIDAIASQGVGATAPSYHELRGSILKNLIQEVRNDVDQKTSSWGRTGCSILADEWDSGKGKIFLNFFVYCPEGTIFLRSADVTHTLDSLDALYELFKETVEEVGVRNVLQMITGSEDRYFSVAKRLSETYPNVFHSPCAGDCVDLMLKDIGELPRVKMVIEQAKSISKYIYSNNVVLNMMRRYTFGVDLVDVGPTRFSTDFMTLKRMVNIRHNLQSMVTSEEWMDSPYSKKNDGLEILDFISNPEFWSTCASIARLTDPILRLLRIVGSENRPAMGFIYVAMYRVKETIKKELVDKEEYLVYKSIIERRWEPIQSHPLHAAGFYFNPKYFYSLEEDLHPHIRSLVYDCIEKLVPDPDIQDKIMKETTSYHGGIGDFGRKMAIRARDTLSPTEWWLAYGGGCPNLARMAIRILSQTCSLRPHHKLNKFPLEHLHEKKNRLEHQRVCDLVFMQYNMSLNQKVVSEKERENPDPISYENFEIVEDWTVEKETCLEGNENADWMAVDPPLGNVMLLGPQINDVEALGTGFGDYEIFHGVKENGEENIASL